ncbi:hypothetical protein BT93_F0968 [Corymbia citriodora subsp. variegata]|nr:hypothetical protein BT93_F0968 [Corymbia citriodora subsp. variegata]
MVKRTSEPEIQLEPSSKRTSPSSSSACRKYKGVRMRSWGSWVSEIRTPNQKARIWLGSYANAEAAARAYDAALLCLKGSSAPQGLNFPRSSLALRIPDHAAPMSPKSIQRVAAAAAAAAAEDEGGSRDCAASSPQTPLQQSPSPSSSSLASSPLPPDHPDEEVVVVPAAAWDGAAGILDTWCNLEGLLQSPRFLGPPFASGASSDDYYEEAGDILLWNFC